MKKVVSLVIAVLVMLTTGCQARSSAITSFTPQTTETDPILLDQNGITYTQSQWNGLMVFDDSIIQSKKDALANYRDARGHRTNGSNALNDLYDYLLEQLDAYDGTMSETVMDCDHYDLDQAYLSFIDHNGKTIRIDTKTLVNATSIDDTVVSLTYAGNGQLSDLQLVAIDQHWVLIDCDQDQQSTLAMTLDQLARYGANGAIVIDHSNELITSYPYSNTPIPVMVIDASAGQSIKDELLLYGNDLTITIVLSQSIDASSMKNISFTIDGKNSNETMLIAIPLDGIDDIDTIDAAIASGLVWLDHIASNPLNHAVTFLFYSGSSFSKRDTTYGLERGLMAALSDIDDVFCFIPLYGQGEGILATQEYQGILSALIQGYDRLLSIDTPVSMNTDSTNALTYGQNKGLSGFMEGGDQPLSAITMNTLHFILDAMDHYTLMPLDFSYRFETLESQLEDDAILSLSQGNVNEFKETLVLTIDSLGRLDQWIIDHQFQSDTVVNERLRQLNSYIQACFVSINRNGLTNPLLAAQENMVSISDALLALQANDLETAKQDLYKIDDYRYAIYYTKNVWLDHHQYAMDDDPWMRSYVAWHNESMGLYDVLWAIIDGQTNAIDDSTNLIEILTPYSENASALVADALESATIQMAHIHDLVRSIMT